MQKINLIYQEIWLAFEKDIAFYYYPFKFNDKEFHLYLPDTQAIKKMFKNPTLEDVKELVLGELSGWRCLIYKSNTSGEIEYLNKTCLDSKPLTFYPGVIFQTSNIYPSAAKAVATIKLVIKDAIIFTAGVVSNSLYEYIKTGKSNNVLNHIKSMFTNYGY